jgi:hypothetical protein
MWLRLLECIFICFRGIITHKNEFVKPIFAFLFTRFISLDVYRAATGLGA